MQKLTRTLALTGALAFAGVLAGCGDDVTVEDTLEVTVTPATANVAVGGSVTLTASVTGTNPNKNVNWTTSDASKATVDATGKVTGVAVGSATIVATAAADAGVKGSALVTVTRADLGVQRVDVSPTTDILPPGGTRQLVANVTANPGVARTVTWSSSATNIATVSTSGVITAVAVGNATITAASTVDPTVSGSMALTVRPIQAATVSIQKITVAGNTASPVNPNNVTGQIDVTLNVNPGEQTITKVEVLIDGAVACSQNMSVAESEALRMAAAFEEIEAVDVVCSVNTAAFSPTTGAVNFANGTHQISARGTIGGTTPGNVASPSVPLVFNNQSGFIALATTTNTNAGFPTSAVNPTTGQKWFAGSVQLKLAAVNYAPGGATVTSLNAAYLGKTFSDTPDAGTQIFTIDFPNSGTGALNLVGYQTSAASQTVPVVTGSNLSNGNTGPTVILNVGAKADTLGLPRFDSTRVDNVVPAAPTVGAFPAWVTKAFTFTAANSGITGLSDTGVNDVKADIYVIKGALPTASACDVTGMTKVTDAQGLTESLSTEYNGKAIVFDALGNRVCVNLGNPFGADFGAPQNVKLTGVSNQQGFTSTAAADGTNYGFSTDGDTLSGIAPTNPGRISILRMPPTGSNVCELGGTSCAQTAAPISGSITDASGGEGYYTLTAQLADAAGNLAPTPAITVSYVVDGSVPTFTGGLTLSPTYAGNAPAAIGGVSVSDNLDLGKLYAQVNYTAAGINLEYASQTLGSYGPALEKTFSGSYTIPSLIRCMAPAGGPFTASNANKAQDVSLFATDQAGGISLPKTPTAGDFAPRVADCGVVGTLTTGLTLQAFTIGAPSYGTGKTDVDIDGANLSTVSSTTVALSAVADVSQNGGNPFSKVEFYYLNPVTNGYVFIGAASATAGPNTSPTRPWNYAFTWDPGAGVPVGAVTIIAVGVDAEGDAARTATASVTTVQ